MSSLQLTATSAPARSEPRETSAPGTVRLGYLVPQFPGQTHAFFWREIAWLEKLGFDVQVLSTRHPTDTLKSHDWTSDAIDRTRYLWPVGWRDAWFGLLDFLRNPTALRILTTTQRRDPKSILKLLGFAVLGSKLARLSRQLDLQHLHVHSCGDAAYIAMMSRRFGGPDYSLTLHNPLAVYGPDQPAKWSDAEFAIVITKEIEQQVRRDLDGSLPPKIFVAPMGIDPDFLCRSTPYAPWSDGTLRIFSCARLNHVKGHDDLLSALKVVRDQGIDAELTIAGEDDAGGTGYRIRLESHVEQLGLRDVVHLIGAVSEHRVKAELEAAHLFALASHAEPLGVAYMEAMSMGVPTIGTAAGGVPELITHGKTGWLVPPRQPKQLADAIVSLANTPDRCVALGVGGRKEVVENWTSRTSAETIRAAVLDARAKPVIDRPMTSTVRMTQNARTS